MKKILHISVSSDIGGGPQHIFLLLSHLSNKYEMHVACPSPGDYFGKFKTITNDSLIVIPHRKIGFVSFFKFILYVKKNKIDLLHSHGKGAGFYSKFYSLLFRIPIVHTPHGINQQVGFFLFHNVYLKLEKILSFLIHHIIFVSNTERDYSINLNMWSGIPYSIVYNGTNIISDEIIANWRYQKRNYFNLKNLKIIITASRFDYQKNTIEVCYIAEILKEFIFIILGDGDDRKLCQKYCKLNNINNVIFTGNVSDPIKYFAMSDIYLSTSRWEGMSIAILESMSVGLPIIASDVVGNKDIVKNGINGFLYQLHDINEATNLIKELLDENNYSKYSTTSRQIQKDKYSVQIMSDNIDRIYRSVLNI